MSPAFYELYGRDRIVDDDMRPEYDFTSRVRGKHYKVLHEEGYIVRIYNDDGTVTECRVSGERMGILEPDVSELEWILKLHSPWEF